MLVESGGRFFFQGWKSAAQTLFISQYSLFANLLMSAFITADRWKFKLNWAVSVDDASLGHQKATCNFPTDKNQIKICTQQKLEKCL